MLTVSGVAIMYGLAEFRVRQLSDSGVLPHFRDNNERRCYDPEAVERVMKALRREQAQKQADVRGPSAA
jgi:DNA-binding transcriptional MerR regulator